MLRACYSILPVREPQDKDLLPNALPEIGVQPTAQNHPRNYNGITDISTVTDYKSSMTLEVSLGLLDKYQQLSRDGPSTPTNFWKFVVDLFALENLNAAYSVPQVNTVFREKLDPACKQVVI